MVRELYVARMDLRKVSLCPRYGISLMIVLVPGGDDMEILLSLLQLEDSIYSVLDRQYLSKVMPLPVGRECLLVHITSLELIPVEVRESLNRGDREELASTVEFREHMLGSCGEGIV
jgi:hypothetical protein